MFSLKLHIGIKIYLFFLIYIIFLIYYFYHNFKASLNLATFISKYKYIVIIKKHYPLLVSLTFFGLIIFFIVFNVLRTNEGNFTYPLDDTFIHMAIAKNFSNHYVWGLTQYEFNSSSSSLLYTLLISLLYKLYSPNVVIPLILNVFFAIILICVCYKYLKENNISPLKILIVLLSIILFTPLPIIVTEGMEHTLHILLSIVFAYSASHILGSHASQAKRIYGYKGAVINLYLTAFLLPFTRYEGLFIVFIVCCLSLIQKRWKLSLSLGFLSLSSIVIYGFISVHNGSMWAPNSIILKGAAVNFSIKGIVLFVSKPLLVFYDAPWLFNLAISALLLYAIRYKFGKYFWERGQLMITISFYALWLHLEFAGIGWVFRYESYLVALLILTIALFALKKNSMPRIINRVDSLIYVGCIYMLIIILGFKVASRGLKSLNVALNAPKNIYEQQYQMGLFIKKYYQGKGIALNDVGAVCYLANDIKIVDITGLGSSEVAKAIRNDSINSYFMNRLIRKKEIQIAIIYEKFYNGYTSSWKKVAEWQIANNIVCGGDVVTFYAIDSKENLTLEINLRTFEKKLPKTVVVRYFN